MDNLKKSRIILILSLELIGVLALGFFILKKELAVETIPLKQQRWPNDDAGLVIVAPEYRLATTSMYRLRDAKELVMNGSWEFNYVNPSEILVFGFNENKYTEQKLFDVNEQFVQQYEISDLPGKITWVTQNSFGTYFLIEGEREGAKFRCIANKSQLQIKECKEILGEVIKNGDYSSTSTYSIYWNQNHKQQLIIEETGGKNRLLTFDPWDKDPREETDKEKFKKENPGYNSSEPPIRMPPQNPHQIFRFIYLTVIRNTKTNNLYYYLLPPNRTISWVNQTMFLLLDGTRSYIYDLPNRTRSEFVKMIEGRKKVFTYYDPS